MFKTHLLPLDFLRIVQNYSQKLKKKGIRIQILTMILIVTMKGRRKMKELNTFKQPLKFLEEKEDSEQQIPSTKSIQIAQLD